MAWAALEAHWRNAWPPLRCPSATATVARKPNHRFLFITASATPESVGAVNAKVLDALGPDGYLVNVSRGTLVEEATLVEYLTQNRIAGAGLDVFENEPSIPSGLYELENVVLQPHHASGTWETREAMGQLVLDNLAARFSDKPLITPVV